MRRVFASSIFLLLGLHGSAPAHADPQRPESDPLGAMARFSSARAAAAGAVTFRGGGSTSTTGRLEGGTAALSLTGSIGSFRAGGTYGLHARGYVAHLAAFTLERTFAAAPTLLVIPRATVGATIEEGRVWSPDARLSVSLQVPLYRLPFGSGVCVGLGWNGLAGVVAFAMAETTWYLP